MKWIHLLKNGGMCSSSMICLWNVNASRVVFFLFKLVICSLIFDCITLKRSGLNSIAVQMIKAFIDHVFLSFSCFNFFSLVLLCIPVKKKAFQLIRVQGQRRALNRQQRQIYCKVVPELQQQQHAKIQWIHWTINRIHSATTHCIANV